MTIKTGEKFEVMTSITEQVRLDGEAVKDLLTVLERAGMITPEQHKSCYKTISFTVVKTNYIRNEDKPTYTPPDLSNATPEGLVDMLGQTRAEAKKLKADEGFIKNRLLAELEPTSVETESFAQPEPPIDWTEEDEQETRSPSFYELYKSVPGRTIDEKLAYLARKTTTDTDTDTNTTDK